MLGAIIGDILGSVHEKIPNLLIRKEHQLTDDSWLTLASMNWMLELDFAKFKFLYEKKKNNEVRDWLRFESDLINLGKRSLIKWYKIGCTSNLSGSGEIPIFSPGFDSWVKAEESKEIVRVKHKGNTNGCLMRNSPIPYYGYKYSLNIEEVLYLSELFCTLTHKHDDSINAVTLHSTIIYKLCVGEIDKNNYKEFLLQQNIEIKPLKDWYPSEERLKENSKNKFIWDAKQSLNISLSAIYFASSYQEAIDFCNKTDMDTDTYCAIAGPIAELLWDIDSKNKEFGLNIIKSNKDAANLIKVVNSKKFIKNY